MNCKSHFCALQRGGLFSYYLLLCSLFLTTPSFIFSQDCNREIYRSADGACNNLRNNDTQYFGQAKRPFIRTVPAYYSAEDVFNGILFPNRPNPRAISNAIFSQNSDTGNEGNLSSFVFTWAQFLDHDITFTKGSRTEPANISLPPNEPSFSTDISFNRSAVFPGTGVFTPRDQENELTAWIDGSQVYGSDIARANWLRTFNNGKLKTSSGNLLPFNTLNGEKTGVIDANAPEMDNLDNGQAPHFVAGDVRAGEQPGLTTLHTLFLREHNRICDELIANGLQDDELLYQMARKQIGALIQVITYEQFLPALGIELSPYAGYDNQVSPDITNIFATAAYRIGYTMVTSELLLLNNDCSAVRNPLSLEQAFFNSQWIEQLGINPFLKGLANQQQEAIDAKVVDGLRNFLFAIPQLPGTFGLDLAAINIQRGRDHGLPDYRTARRYYTGQDIFAFSQINTEGSIAQDLATVYNNDLNEVDLWVGLLAEEHLPNKNIGRTMHEILASQFERIRAGDYYYFEHDPFFDFQTKQTLKNTTLATIIERNTNLTNLTNDVFHTETCAPVLVNCDAIEINALDGQIEIQGLTAPFSTVKIFDKNAGWSVVANCNGIECGTTQVFDLPAGDYFVQITFYEGFWSNQICQKEMDISVNGSASFDCENVTSTVNQSNLEINGLTAPFSTIKIFDKNAGWSVIADCTGENCSENPIFNLPTGDYHLQLSAYQSPWQDLICHKSFDFSIGTTNTANCDDIIVAANNGAIEVRGLSAPFCTVKIFDMNNGWNVVADCAGDDCGENPSFVMQNPTGQYAIEVTMYQNFWQNELCQQFFELTMNASASNRNKDELSVAVFPNPVQEIIYVNLQEHAEKTANLQLTNQFGQVVKNLDYPMLSKNVLEIPVSNLPNGLYYLTMKVADRLPITKKIMVSRLY